MTDIAKVTDPAAAAPSPERIRVWDLPVRLFHWTLVPLIAAAWWTAEERMLEWHRLAGYAILTLLLFRIGWGLWGSTTARFRHFVKGPGAVIRHGADLIHRRPHGHVGHNPMGGWSVVAMIGLLVAQVTLGLFAVDVDGMESGPLSYLVDFDTGRIAAETHDLVFNLLLGLIGLHLAAILFHRIHGRHDLIGPMLHGRAPRPDGAGAQGEIGFAPNWLALLTLAVVAGLVWLLVRQPG